MLFRLFDLSQLLLHYAMKKKKAIHPTPVHLCVMYCLLEVEVVCLAYIKSLPFLLCNNRVYAQRISPHGLGWG